MLLALAACQQLPPSQPVDLAPTTTVLSLTDSLDGTAIHIECPANWNGQCLLALPGWNLPALDWKTKTHLIEQARQTGIAVVMPELGKSIYARKQYPETRADWRTQRLLSWVSDSLPNWLQSKYGLFTPGANHAVIGLSTGGRGAVLLAAARPDLFSACGAFSGDFIPERMPADNLMRGWYGWFETFPGRWRGSEHPVGVVDQLQAQLFIAHGAEDAIVPCDQSRAFVDLLYLKRPELRVHCWLPDSIGHDYAFWQRCAAWFWANWIGKSMPE